MAAIEFRLLGPLEVRRGGQRLDVTGHKRRTLLAVLLLHAGQAVSTDQLIDVLWGESPPAGAANALQAHIGHLRRTLGGDAMTPLHTRAPGYLIDAGGELDINRFELLAAEGRRVLRRDPASAAESLSAALGLWRGPALAEFVYEPFAEGEAARLEELRLGAREDHLEAELILGRHAAAVPELEALLDVHPFRERLATLLMTALYRSGRQADATRVFQRTRERLVDELGLNPGSALRELHQRVLDQDPRLESASPTLAPDSTTARTPSRRVSGGDRAGNLPAELTSFIGREQERRQIARALADGRLVTLTGPGGSGKTRLALRVARELEDAYPDGAWLAELAPLSDPGLVPKALADALGVHGSSGSELEALDEWVRGKRLLVILDNCEHLVAACAHVVGTLLQAGRELRVLATSRELLSVAGEVTWPVPGLALPASTDPLDAVERSAAVSLFVERARATSPGFTLDSENAAAVVDLCEHLDGMPLAIELAAARVRSLSPQEIGARLHDRFGLLTGGPRGSSARQQTLRATVDWSHDLLTAGERVLYRRTAVFAGGWTLADAEQVCADDTEPRSGEVLDDLGALVDKSLVFSEPSSATTRYGMLETLREYALEQLALAGERETVGQRHFEHFLTLAERAREHKLSSGGDAGLATLLSQQDNLRAALGFARERNPMQLLRLATAMDQVWHAGNLEEGRHWLTEGLADAPQATVVRARALHLAGSLADLQQDHDAARRLLSDAVALAESLGDDGVAAWSRLSLGMTELTAERFDVALEHLRGALAAHERTDNRLGICRAFIYIGWVHTQTAATARVARRELERGLRMAQEIEDSWGEGFALMWLGYEDIAAGNHELAAARFRGTLLTEPLGPIRGGALDGFATLVLAHDPARALRLIAAAGSLRRRHAGNPPPFLRRRAEAIRSEAERRLEVDVARTAWEEGLRMTTAEAIAYALRDRDP